MICPDCCGSGWLEAKDGWNGFKHRPCPDCRGCGIVHCCEGECVDQAGKDKPHEAEEVK